MAMTSQQKNMKDLAKLMAHDLSYIAGDRENGPNGAKRIFLSKGRAFLRTLGQDLRFAEQRLYVNKAGIAVSGEVYLQGMWPNGNGLFIMLEQMIGFPADACILYRTIERLDKCTGGTNQYVSRNFLETGNYEALLDKFLCEKRTIYTPKVAA